MSESNIRVSFFTSNQEPRGQVEGTIALLKEDDERIECYGMLEDGRHVEIILKRRRKNKEVKPTALTPEEIAEIEAEDGVGEDEEETLTPGEEGLRNYNERKAREAEEEE